MSASRSSPSPSPSGRFERARQSVTKNILGVTFLLQLYSTLYYIGLSKIKYVPRYFFALRIESTDRVAISWRPRDAMRRGRTTHAPVAVSVFVSVVVVVVGWTHGFISREVTGETEDERRYFTPGV